MTDNTRSSNPPADKDRAWSIIKKWMVELAGDCLEAAEANQAEWALQTIEKALQQPAQMQTKAIDDAAYSAMVDAIDVADRLIERAYGVDVPQDWNDAFKSVADARKDSRKKKTPPAQAVQGLDEAIAKSGAAKICLNSDALRVARAITSRENQVVASEAIDLDKLQQDLNDAVVIGTEMSGPSPTGEPHITVKRVNSAFRILEAARLYAQLQKGK